MKAIILAGGKGTRLSSVVPDLPKPLAPVQGQPFISILANFLVAHGVNDIIISTFHLAEKFEAHLPALKSVSKNVLLVKEPAALGTGGAVKFACREINSSEQVLVLNGDTFFNFNLSGFLAEFCGRNALALKHVNDASRYGSVNLENDRIKNFAEKSPNQTGGLIYAGFSLLLVENILSFLPNGPSSLENDFFPKFLKNSMPLYGKAYPGDFIDIGVPSDYEMANKHFNFSSFGKPGA